MMVNTNIMVNSCYSCTAYVYTVHVWSRVLNPVRMYSGVDRLFSTSVKASVVELVKMEIEETQECDERNVKQKTE